MLVHVKYTDGRPRQVPRQVLEQLRMLADWQLRAMDICPASVTAACQWLDEHQANCRGGGCHD